MKTNCQEFKKQNLEIFAQLWKKAEGSRVLWNVITCYGVEKASLFQRKKRKDILGIDFL